MNLSAANTAIVLDSTSDFPEANERFANWRMVPLYVRFGDESRRDYVEIGPQEFYARLRTVTELPTTSQPTAGDFLAAYEELAEYERIYSLQISATLSGTFESARTAAAELGDKVRVIDTGSASAAITMLGFAIQRRLERGATDDEIDELVERYKRDARLLFTVDTLEFLQKGGRIGKAAAFAGNLLHIKPILTIQGGEVLPVKRVRGNQKAVQEFARAFTEGSRDTPNLHVGIAHADAPERAQVLRSLVADLRPQAQIDVTTTLGAVVGTHAGPGTVGFFWFEDDIGG
ncbi:MAG: DegV family protein [Actinomycetota bacterium]|nr:DegV family protein [Actinomycetota bacterium]